MVSLRFAAIALLLAAYLPVAAQNYSTDDTISEYPNAGTWYHNRFEGRKTANGETFDQNKFTAAHWKIKMGTYVMVTNRNTGLQVIVRVNDRCPKRGVFDMSHRAANAIGIRGCQPVTIRLLPDTYHDRWAAQESQFDSVYTTLGHSPSTQKPATNGNKRNDTLTHAPSYHLILDTLPSPAAAQEQVSLLALPYQGQAQVKQIAPNKYLLWLPLGMNREKTAELQKALIATFPRCVLTASAP